MYEIGNENITTKKEIDIRGRYLMMACDIEFCLFNIIMFCNPNPNNHERAGQFKNMKMNGKIECVIADLKKYKPQYFIEFEEDLNGLEEFRIVRNDMSHNKGSFPKDPDLSVFEIIYVDKENGKELLKFKDYTEEYIKESVDRFATLNRRLTSLWMRLKNESDLKNPPSHLHSTGNNQTSNPH